MVLGNSTVLGSVFLKLKKKEIIIIKKIKAAQRFNFLS